MSFRPLRLHWAGLREESEVNGIYDLSKQYSSRTLGRFSDFSHSFEMTSTQTGSEVSAILQLILR